MEPSTVKETNAIIQELAEYFSDIGEVKILAALLGFTKNSINRVNTAEYPELVTMSKKFMKGYIAAYYAAFKAQNPDANDAAHFADASQKFFVCLATINKKMNKNLHIEDIKKSVLKVDTSDLIFETREITTTFPTYEHIVDISAELIQKPSEISRFITLIHSKCYSDMNPRFYLTRSDIEEIRNRFHSRPDSVDDIYLAKLRGLDICGAAEQCKVDLLERVFELLCYWKEYSYGSQLNYELLCFSFLEISNNMFAEDIKDKYIDWKDSPEKNITVLVEKI